VDDTPGGQVLRDGEAADLDYSHTTRVRCRSRAGSGLQRPFNSHQVSVWVSVRRRTAAPRRLQRFLNSHVSASRDAPERAKAELESGCMSSPGGRALSPGWPSPTANSWRWVGCGIVVKLSGPNDRQSFVRTPTGSRKQRHECGRSSRTCCPPSAA